MLPPTRSPGMGHPVSPSLGSARDNYTTSPPGLPRIPHTLSPRHSDLPRYSSLTDTPRSVLSNTMPQLSTSGAYGANAVVAYQSESPPFNAQQDWHQITCDGNTVIPDLQVKIDKGFFWSTDRVWTCYRRNYFAVTVNYGLNPWPTNQRLYLDKQDGKGPQQIQSMAVSLAAAVDGAGGKGIDLIQHTPKRDKGPQIPMKKEPLSPTPPGKSHEHSAYTLNSHYPASTVAGPQLPLQNDSEPSNSFSPTSHANSNTSHTFERIQFKSATANNGKRRAQQQYYHLIVELWANTQNPREDSPSWIKIAARSSQPVVVRGRSPSHYSNEGPHNSNAPRGGGGSGVGGPGNYPGLGSNGGPTYGSTYGRSGMSGPAGMGGSVYRGNNYSLDPSPVGSHSVSSASSMSGGPGEGLVDQHMADEEDTKMMEHHEQYQYYPSTIYEGIQSKAEALGLPLPDRRIKEEFPGPAAGVASNWSVGGCGRYQGMETSRGYYPDVHAHVGY
jgi:meiosis-specific transcription factor NDT80